MPHTRQNHNHIPHHSPEHRTRLQTQGSAPFDPSHMIPAPSKTNYLPANQRRPSTTYEKGIKKIRHYTPDQYFLWRIFLDIHEYPDRPAGWWCDPMACFLLFAHTSRAVPGENNHGDTTTKKNTTIVNSKLYSKQNFTIEFLHFFFTRK